MNFTSEEKIKKLENKISASRSPKQQCSLLIDIAMELRYSNPVVSLQYAQQALDTSVEINFSNGKARSFFCMGLVNFNLSEYEKAFIYFDNAYRVFLEAGDQWGISNVLNNIGLIYLRLGDYTKALDHFLSSLEIKKESHDRYGTANVMISMAAIHRETGNYTDAELLLKESLLIGEELKSDVLLSKGLLELGVILSMENKLPEAIENFYSAKSFYQKQNNPAGVAQCFLHLGKAKSTTGDSADAVALFEEGKKIAGETGDKSLITIFLCSIAEEKLKAGEPAAAIALLNEAKQIASKTQEKPVLSNISRLLSTGYEATDNLKEALYEFRNAVALRDEINSVEAATQLRNQQISNKVEALQSENKILEGEKTSAQNQLTAVLNMQEIKSLNAMMDGQEKERKRIAADLHDRVGGSLAAIKLHLESFIKSHTELSQTQNQILFVKQMLDDVVKEVRRVSHDLASGVLIKFGIVPALKDLCDSIGSAGNVKVNFFSAGFEERVDSRIEISFYRITQELITNILKHARANEINIHLSRFETHLLLLVEDDGVGFDTAKAFEGIGMKNIRSW
ncbi:MAG: sensor histidine kinase [Chitinophagales bacterium]|nr:sensor histidine kinase [Chitinophagales bacterium]